jgi:hypothetical protein
VKKRLRTLLSSKFKPMSNFIKVMTCKVFSCPTLTSEVYHR